MLRRMILTVRRPKSTNY